MRSRIDPAAVVRDVPTGLVSTKFVFPSIRNASRARATTSAFFGRSATLQGIRHTRSTFSLRTLKRATSADPLLVNSSAKLPPQAKRMAGLLETGLLRRPDYIRTACIAAAAKRRIFLADHF